MKLSKGLTLCLITLALFSASLPVHASPPNVVPENSFSSNHGSMLLYDQEYDKVLFFYKPTISTLTILNQANFFKAGDTIRFEMTGTPHASASVAIAGLAGQIPLTEVSTGRYRGIFVVPADVRLYDAQLIGHLDLSRHGYRDAEAMSTVSVTDGSVFVHVTSPIARQFVRHNLKVSGDTTPNAHLVVSARYPSTATGASETVTAEGVADMSGHFRVPLHFNRRAPIDASQVELNVLATDPITSMSRQVEFNVATGE